MLSSLDMSSMWADTLGRFVKHGCTAPNSADADRSAIPRCRRPSVRCYHTARSSLSIQAPKQAHRPARTSGPDPAQFADRESGPCAGYAARLGLLQRLLFSTRAKKVVPAWIVGGEV